MRSGSTIASVRIGSWLSILLGIPLHDDDKILAEGPLDNLFIINGSTLYCHHLESIAEAVRKAKNVIWIQNDYTLPPPKSESAAQSPFRLAFAERGLVPHFWSTCSENSNRTERSAWVNWNVLGYKKDIQPAKFEWNDFLYYGAYRENRKDSFQWIYESLVDEKLVISSTSAKFPDKYRVPPFRSNFYEDIKVHGMGIYAQDRKSWGWNHSPATRFYEMLSVGLPMCFTPDCVETLSRYKLDVSPYVLSIHTARELMNRRTQIAQSQREAWTRDYESGLAIQVTELYASLNQ